MTKTHTPARVIAPLPWALDERGNVVGLIRAADGTAPVFIPYGDYHGPAVCETLEERRELAARIVRTVNAHAAAMDALNLAVMDMGRAGANYDTKHPLRKAWEAARAAIQKAEGKE